MSFTFFFASRVFTTDDKLREFPFVRVDLFWMSWDFTFPTCPFLYSDHSDPEIGTFARTDLGPSSETALPQLKLTSGSYFSRKTKEQVNNRGSWAQHIHG